MHNLNADNFENGFYKEKSMDAKILNAIVEYMNAKYFDKDDKDYGDYEIRLLVTDKALPIPDNIFS